MSEHKWHLEHEDGREWTDDELQKLVRAECYRGESLFTPVITDRGGCFVLDNRHRWHSLKDDVVVVWDE